MMITSGGRRSAKDEQQLRAAEETPTWRHTDRARRGHTCSAKPSTVGRAAYTYRPNDRAGGTAMGGCSPLLVDVDGEFGVKVVLPGRPNPASNREKRAQLGSGVVRKRKTCSGRWDVHAMGGKFGGTLLGV